MNTKERYILFLLSAVLLLIVVFFANYLFTGYHFENGQVIGMSYTASGVGFGVGQVNGQPANVTTFTPEQYILIIDVNGNVNSYSVTPETYAKALSGQVTFQMKCNAFLCSVVE